MTGYIEFYIVFFAVYSFSGWVIEVIYRSSKQNHLINAGLMHGPFVPIYGLGAFIIIGLENVLDPIHIMGRLAIYFLLLSVLEYSAGFLLEKIFKLKLWDYSDHKLNLHGRVCLLFSVFWAGFAYIFIEIIHPFVSETVLALDRETVRFSAMAFTLYFGIDIILSATSAAAFRKKITYLYSEYLNLDNFEVENIMKSIRRLYMAFPNINNYIKSHIDLNLKERVGDIIDNVHDKVVNGLSGRRPVEAEYLKAVEDILNNEEFRKLKNFFHHNSSIYEHVLRVSYFSYSICKLLKLDYISAARGALLHDFFLYDWRNHDLPDLAKDKFHGLEHPQIALTNSEKQFQLNEIEKDIILRHMWPLTLFPPRFRESFVVTFADKYVSSREFIDEIRKKSMKDKN